MPKEMEEALKKAAAKKGLKKDSSAWRAYIYGRMRKTGWKPKREIQ